MGYLETLIVENFKSWSGRQVLGPFRPGLTCVVGPNGSGKSNVMDAICFVVGLNAKTLRGDKLKDLVCSLPPAAGGPAPRTASVTLVYVCTASDEGRPLGQKMSFSRAITAAGSSVYRLDGAETDQEAYLAALEGICIKPRARNFLIFQGDVETVAQKNPMDMMAHFEAVSGSAELKCVDSGGGGERWGGTRAPSQHITSSSCFFT